MGIEIERKFLVSGEGWQTLASPVEFRQGYLCANVNRSVRVRVAGENAWLTIKGSNQGANGEGLSRAEFEYAIPRDEGLALLDLCEGNLIEKERRAIPFRGFIWEVDCFKGANQGLVIAEVELKTEDQTFEKPDWIGEEVSSDSRYLNANLVKCPFSEW